MQEDEVAKTAALWTVAAFLFAPFVIALGMAFWDRPSNQYDVVTALGLMPVFYFFATLPLTIFGIPVYLTLRHVNCLNIWTILASGGVIGAISAFALRLPGMAEANDVRVCVMLGSLGALGFWVCWSRAPV
jgi:hypothetical protein